MTTLSIAPREHQIELQGVPGARDQAELLAVPDQGERKVEFVFAPKSGGRACSLALFNDHFVEFRRAGRRKGRADVFNLAFVDPKPNHEVYRSIVWWGLAVLAAAALAAGAYLQLWPIVVAGAVCTAVFGVIARRTQRNRWVFYSRHGREALFELNQSRADRQRLKKLMGILAKRGQQAWTRLPRGKERLGIEVAEHRRLLDSGSISKDQYERAKSRIFGRYKQ